MNNYFRKQEDYLLVLTVYCIANTFKTLCFILFQILVYSLYILTRLYVISIHVYRHWQNSMPFIPPLCLFSTSGNNNSLFMLSFCCFRLHIGDRTRSWCFNSCVILFAKISSVLSLFSPNWIYSFSGSLEINCDSVANCFVPFLLIDSCYGSPC